MRRSSNASRLGIRMFVAAACVLQLAACADMQMGQPKPTLATLTQLRSARLAPMEVGAFTVDASRDAGIDQAVSIRSNTLRSPVDGSFSHYLRESLRVELASAGLLRPNADSVVSGVLTESVVNAPIGTGTASLGARFVVTRAGNVRYDRQLNVNAEWDSPFVGVTAIPQAAGQYEGLYRKLVGELLMDPAFRNAVGSP